MKGAVRTRKADQIILALLEQGTIERAATAVGVSPVTVWRWLQKPEFQEACRKARRDAFSRSIARLQHAAGAAVSTLLKVMVDKDAPAASRLRAADSVLAHAAEALELEDIEVRLARLEQWEKNKIMMRWGKQRPLGVWRSRKEGRGNEKSHAVASGGEPRGPRATGSHFPRRSFRTGSWKPGRNALAWLLTRILRQGIEYAGVWEN